MEGILRELVLNKSDRLSVQFLRYIVVGGVSTIVDWIIFYSCIRWGNIGYISALVPAFTAGIAVSYAMSKMWVFNTNKYDQVSEFIYFIIIGIIGLFISFITMKFFIEILAVIPMLARIMTTVITLVWNFGARKYLLF